MTTESSKDEIREHASGRRAATKARAVDNALHESRPSGGKRAIVPSVSAARTEPRRGKTRSRKK